MANSFVQFRIDETSKIKAMNICEQLGIDLQTYLRMCVAKLVQANGIPFDLVLKDNPALEAMKKASCIAKENGIQDMTLDEINAEILEARK